MIAHLIFQQLVIGSMIVHQAFSDHLIDYSFQRPLLFILWLFSRNHLLLLSSNLFSFSLLISYH